MSSCLEPVLRRGGGDGGCLKMSGQGGKGRSPSRHGGNVDYQARRRLCSGIDAKRLFATGCR